MSLRLQRSLPKLFLFLVIMLVLAACSPEEKAKKGKVVARAYGEELRKAELDERIPENLSKKDSQNLANSFVRNWVREQVLLHQAQERLKEGKKDIEGRVESYRSSLLVHSLEEEVVKERLDTSVSREEVERFYKEHKKEFNLKEAIVRVNYVQLSADSAYYAPQFLRLLRKDEMEREEALRERCAQSAVHCHLNGREWMRFRELMSETPLDVENVEAFLENNQYLRSRHEGGIFLLRILDHRTKNEIEPLSMVRDRIRAMILNDRKSSIVENFYQNALRDARKNDAVQLP